MNEYHQGHHQRSNRSQWVFIGFLAVGAFLLLSEHRAHLLGALPFLLLLACPIMHLFHHRGHGGSGDTAGPRDTEAPPNSGHRH